MTEPQKIDSNRRGFFAFAALPLLIFGLGSRARAATAPAPSCMPPTLPSGQVGMRKSLNFRQSTDPQKRCGLCNFFTASSAGCGRCQLLQNGPVSINTVCDSWAKKA